MASSPSSAAETPERRRAAQPISPASSHSTVSPSTQPAAAVDDSSPAPPMPRLTTTTVLSASQNDFDWFKHKVQREEFRRERHANRKTREERRIAHDQMECLYRAAFAPSPTPPLRRLIAQARHRQVVYLLGAASCFTLLIVNDYVHYYWTGMIELTTMSVTYLVILSHCFSIWFSVYQVAKHRFNRNAHRDRPIPRLAEMTFWWLLLSFVARGVLEWQTFAFREENYPEKVAR